MQSSYAHKMIISQNWRQKCSTSLSAIRARARQTLPDTAAQTGYRACKCSLPSVTETFTSWASIAFPFRLPHPTVAQKKNRSKQVRGDGSLTPSRNTKIKGRENFPTPANFDPRKSTRTVSKTHFDNTQFNRWSGLLRPPGRRLF